MKRDRNTRSQGGRPLAAPYRPGVSLGHVVAALALAAFAGPPGSPPGNGRRSRRGAWRDESRVWYAQNGRPPVDAATLRDEQYRRTPGESIP